MADIPPPPDGRFGKWAYQLWDYVARNRLGAAAALVAGTAIVVGTGTGTFTLALATSGVGAGTYGTGATWPRFSVDALGRMLTATSGGTLGPFGTIASIVAAGVVTGTSTTGTLTTAENFKVGSSTTGGMVPVLGALNPNLVLLTHTGTSGAVVNTVSFSMSTYSLPAGGLGGSGGLTLTAWGTSGPTSPDKLVARFGTGNTVVSTGIAYSRWEIQLDVLHRGTAQEYSGRFVSFDGTSARYEYYNGTLGVALTTVTPIVIGGTITILGTGTISERYIAQRGFRVQIDNNTP